MKEKTINILGKDIDLIYCQATEKAFEDISPKDISIFFPREEKDENGNAIVLPATATVGDYVMLGFAAIVACSTKKKEKRPPVDGDDLMFEMSPAERDVLIGAIIELKNQWYGIPNSVEEMLKKEAEAQPNGDEQPKNV